MNKKKILLKKIIYIFFNKTKEYKKINTITKYLYNDKLNEK